MSFNPFSAPLSLKIKPSLQKWLMVVIPHLLAVILIISVAEISSAMAVVLFVAIASSLSYFLRLHLFHLSRRSIVVIQQDSVKNWLILLAKDNEMKKVNLLSSSFMSNYFIILNYSLDNATNLFSKYTVLISRDSLSADEFRILKARLNMAHVT